MADRPILFSAPMVRALLAGTKTQTRRLLPMKKGAQLRGQLRFAMGDRLWVKETWTHTGIGVWTIADARSGISAGRPAYRADEPIEGAKYWPSLFMPREFSRLTLHVTEVRIQRVQEISREDEVAEGVEPGEFYDMLWDSLNAKRAPWASNPWVVALTFTVEHANIDHARAAA